MSDFISNETKKIELENGKWIEIKTELPYQDMFSLAGIEKDPSKITDVLVKCIVNWNLEDDKGVASVERKNIEKLKMNYIEPILTAITQAISKNTEIVKKK